MSSSPHYIGRTPAYGAFGKQTITGDSSTVSFALTYGVSSAGAILVVKAGEVLQPDVDYTIGSGGGYIIFTVAPTGAQTVFIMFLGSTTLSVPSTAVVEQDTFTGDATTVDFTLTSPPYSSANLLVLADGISQKLTTNYTLSGSTLTFTSAPDSGAEIEVFHFKTAITPNWTTISAGDGVRSVTLSTGGSGYTAAPSVVFTAVGTGGTGAAATAYIATGAVIGVVVTTAGSGYTAAPTVTFTPVGTGGTGAAATAVWDQAALTLDIQSGGKYLADPPIGGLTLNLPAAPAVGDEVRVVNISSASYDVTVARNGNDIDNAASNITLATGSDSAYVVYANATVGWQTL